MHDTAFNYELSSHLDELVLIQSAEEKLGLDALLQPRPLLVCLGVHHLHMMMMMMMMMMRMMLRMMMTRMMIMRRRMMTIILPERHSSGVLGLQKSVFQ